MHRLMGNIIALCIACQSYCILGILFFFSRKGICYDSPQETMHVDIQEVGRDAHLDVYIRSSSDVIDKKEKKPGLELTKLSQD